MFLCEYCHGESDCSFVHMRTERRQCHNCGNPAVCVDCETASPASLPQAASIEPVEPERVCTHPFHGFENYYAFKQCPNCEEPWKNPTAQENASSLVDTGYYPRGKEPQGIDPVGEAIEFTMGGDRRITLRKDEEQGEYFDEEGTGWLPVEAMHEELERERERIKTLLLTQLRAWEGDLRGLMRGVEAVANDVANGRV